MVLRDQLRGLTFSLAIESEVLDQIKQVQRLAYSSDHRVEAHDPFFALIVDLLPFRKVLPTSRNAANSTLGTVRENDHRVVPEDLWDRGAIIRKIVFVCVLKRFVRCLEFNEDKR